MIVGHCVVCGRSIQNPGKLRGFRLADHTCPCGGAIQRGRGTDPYLPHAYAVPLPNGHVTAASATPRRPRTSRGAADRLVLTVLVLLSLGLILAGALVGSVYRLGLAQGRGDLFAEAVAARAELDAIAPRIDATTQACNALSASPLVHRSVR